MAFKLKMVEIVPSANNSITHLHFPVEGTGDKDKELRGVVAAGIHGERRVE